jgi:hypothetical protein
LGRLTHTMFEHIASLPNMHVRIFFRIGSDAVVTQ